MDEATKKGMLEDSKKLLGLPDSVKNEDDLQEALADGQVLCNKLRELYPECKSKFKVNTSKMAFKKMENIGFYCDYVKGYGIRDEYCFSTVDLYEGKNMPQVLINLSNVYTMAKGKGQI